jgi:hypothetical protein
MRIYSDFWRGKTGRALAGEPALLRCVALYLLTCQAANSQGLYRIHLGDIAYDIGSGADAVSVTRCMVRLGELGFADYDLQSEFVWVRRMAAFQYAPMPLHGSDNRTKGVERWYRACPDNPFLGVWWDMYAGPEALALGVDRRDSGVPLSVVQVLPLPSPPLSLTRGLEAPSEALTLLEEPAKRSAPRGFEEFWSLYPKKRAKARCEQEWKRQRVTAQDVEVMVRKLRDPFTYWPEWVQNRILDPVNFLKDRRWLDEAAPKPVPVSERSQATMTKAETIRDMMHRQIEASTPTEYLGDGRKGES